MSYNRPIIKFNNILHVYGSFLLLLFIISFSAAQPSRNGVPPPPNPIGGTPSNQNFKPSMLVVIIVLITAFFFMGFFSIYLRQCVGENSTGIGGSIRRQANFARRSRRTPKGLDPALIETFPTFIYSVVKGLKIGNGTLECAVCLNEFEDDETLRLLPKCNHVFHPECIDAWLVSHTTCPVCRCNLNEVSENDETTTTTIDQVPPEEESGEHNNNIVPEEIISESQEQVLIRVNGYNDDDEENNKKMEISQVDVINPIQIPIQNRPVRSKSTKPGKFPRSHSTGHSLVQPGDNVERFTLRLPDDVRKQIVAEAQLNRAASYADFRTRQKSVSGSGSSTGQRLQGIRGGSQGSGGGGGAGRSGKYFHFGRLDRAAKSDHWGFKLTVPFFTRNPSVRSPRKDDGAVKSTFENNVGVKGDGSVSGTNNGTTSGAAGARPPV